MPQTYLCQCEITSKWDSETTLTNRSSILVVTVQCYYRWIGFPIYRLGYNNIILQISSRTQRDNNHFIYGSIETVGTRDLQSISTPSINFVTSDLGETLVDVPSQEDIFGARLYGK